MVDEEKKAVSEAKAITDREDRVQNCKADIGKGEPQDWEKNMGERGFEDPYGEIVNNVPVGIKIEVRKNKFPMKKCEVYLEWVQKTKDQQEDREASRASYVDPPPRPEEKRKLYIGRETPVLAPLTFVLLFRVRATGLMER